MTDHDYQLESFAAIRKRLGWRLHVGIWIFGIGGSFITMYFCPSYFWPVMAASGAIGITLLRFWLFSRRGWFWMTLATMALLQVPFVIISRDVASNWKYLFAFPFMLVDLVVMDSVVRWISPELNRDS
jgi:hypothetical protein